MHIIINVINNHFYRRFSQCQNLPEGRAEESLWMSHRPFTQIKIANLLVNHLSCFGATAVQMSSICKIFINVTSLRQLSQNINMMHQIHTASEVVMDCMERHSWNSAPQSYASEPLHNWQLPQHLHYNRPHL